jgi:hypothetical protein
MGRENGCRVDYHSRFVVIAMITELGDIKAAITEDKLFRRAVDDAIMAIMRPLIGLTLAQAIVELDRLRERLELERVQHHDRPRPTIRIPGGGSRRNLSATPSARP